MAMMPGLRSSCILLLQALLNDIMAMTRADPEATSSDSSPTQHHDLPCDTDVHTPSNQAQSAPVSAASRPQVAEKGTAQCDGLQGRPGAHQQGVPLLQSEPLSGEHGMPCQDYTLSRLLPCSGRSWCVEHVLEHIGSVDCLSVHLSVRFLI